MTSSPLIFRVLTLVDQPEVLVLLEELALLLVDRPLDDVVLVSDWSSRSSTTLFTLVRGCWLPPLYLFLLVHPFERCPCSRHLKHLPSFINWRLSSSVSGASLVLSTSIASGSLALPRLSNAALILAARSSLSPLFLRRPVALMFFHFFCSIMAASFHSFRVSGWLSRFIMASSRGVFSPSLNVSMAASPSEAHPESRTRVACWLMYESRSSPSILNAFNLL